MGIEIEEVVQETVQTAPAYNNAPEELNKLTGTKNFPLIGYAAMASLALSFVATLIGMSQPKTFAVISIVAAILGIIGFFGLYMGLKKGLLGHKAPMTALLGATAWIYLILQVIGIIVGIATVLMIANGGLGGGIVTGVLGGFLTIVLAIAYTVLAIIVAAKLMGNYTGNVKSIGVYLLVLVICNFLSVIPVIGWLCSLAALVFTILLFLKAIKTFGE